MGDAVGAGGGDGSSAGAGRPLDDIAGRVLAAIGTDPTQGFILLDATGRPRWASPTLPMLFEVDLAAPNALFAAMHPDDVGLVDEIFETEKAGKADETFDVERRFELLVRLRSPRGQWRWVSLRLHNRLDDPQVAGMVLQLTLANQERSTVEAFDAAALGLPTEQVIEQVLDTLVTGGSGDAQAAVFDLEGRCIAATGGAGIVAGDDRNGWSRANADRIDLETPVAGPEGIVHGTLVTTSNFPDVRPFSRSLATFVARRVGLVLDAAHDREELRRQVVSDPLTGLHNRRFLYGHLERDDLDPWLCVAFIDLDGFKEINDRLGHHVGDEVLVEVAARLRQLQGPGDVVARLGGDEFVIVRQSTDEVCCTLDRDQILRSITGDLDVSGRQVPLSASVGVACAPTEMRLAVVADADAAMYREKATRRRR